MRQASVISIIEIKKDWKLLWEKENLFFFLLLALFVFLYFIFLWKMLTYFNFFISIFELHLETALTYYSIKKIVLSSYYFLFWNVSHFFVFFIARPFILRNKFFDFEETLKKTSIGLFLVLFFILFSLNPFFLPLSMFSVFFMTYFLFSTPKFSFDKISEIIRCAFIEGGQLSLLFSLPMINIIFLPRLLKRGP